MGKGSAQKNQTLKILFQKIVFSVLKLGFSGLYLSHKWWTLCNVWYQMTKACRVSIIYEIEIVQRIVIQTGPESLLSWVLPCSLKEFRQAHSKIYESPYKGWNAHNSTTVTWTSGMSLPWWLRMTHNSQPCPVKSGGKAAYVHVFILAASGTHPLIPF